MSLRDDFEKSELYTEMVKDPYDGRRGPDGEFMWSRLEYAFLGYQAATERAVRIANEVASELRGAHLNANVTAGKVVSRLKDES